MQCAVCTQRTVRTVHNRPGILNSVALTRREHHVGVVPPNRLYLGRVGMFFSSFYARLA